MSIVDQVSRRRGCRTDRHKVTVARSRSIGGPRIARAALHMVAEPGDLVVVAGKGHETTQTIGGGIARPFDDRAVARELLADMHDDRFIDRHGTAHPRTDASHDRRPHRGCGGSTLISLFGTRYLIVFFRTVAVRVSRSSAGRITGPSTTWSKQGTPDHGRDRHRGRRVLSVGSSPTCATSRSPTRR